MKEDDIEKKALINSKIELLTPKGGIKILPIVAKKPPLLPVVIINKRTTYSFVVFNMIFLWFFPKEIIMSDDVQIFLERLKFLLPNLEYYPPLLSSPKETLFGFTWLWLGWGYLIMLDIPFYFYKHRSAFENEAKMVGKFFRKIFKGTYFLEIDKEAKKRFLATLIGYPFFGYFIYIFLTGLATIRNGVTTGADGILYFDVGAIVFVGQLLIVGCLVGIRWLGIHMLVFTIYYMYYLFFNKSKSKLLS